MREQSRAPAHASTCAAQTARATRGCMRAGVRARGAQRGTWPCAWGTVRHDARPRLGPVSRSLSVTWDDSGQSGANRTGRQAISHTGKVLPPKLLRLRAVAPNYAACPEKVVVTRRRPCNTAGGGAMRLRDIRDRSPSGCRRHPPAAPDLARDGRVRGAQSSPGSVLRWRGLPRALRLPGVSSSPGALRGYGTRTCKDSPPRRVRMALRRRMCQSRRREAPGHLFGRERPCSRAMP